jgi:hypothetical protein
MGSVAARRDLAMINRLPKIMALNLIALQDS